MLTKIEESLIVILQKIKIFDFTLIFTRLFDYDFFVIILILSSLFGVTETKDLFLIFFGIVITLLLKRRIKRIRPFDNNSFVKKINKGHLDKYSFPSGHSFISELLILIIKNKYDITSGTYQYFSLSLIPYFVALSRVYSGDHYPSDVVSGILFARVLFYLFIASFKLFVL